MKKLLILSFATVVLSWEINYNYHPPRCEHQLQSNTFSMCIKSGQLLGVRDNRPLETLKLIMWENLIIPSGRFSGMYLNLHLSNLNEVQNFTLMPRSFMGLYCEKLTLSDITLTVTPNPFEGLKAVSRLDMSNVVLRNFTSEFFSAFPNLDILELRSVKGIPHISPAVLSGVSENLQKLTLCTDMKSIEPGSFAKFYRMNDLQLCGGELHHLKSNLFDGPPNYLTLRLEENQIQTIEPDAFRNLKIAKLILDGNLLEEIPSALSCNSTNVQDISLKSNSLKVINAGPFQNCSRLNRVDFSDNQITSIEPDSFSGSMFSALNFNYNKIKALQNETFRGLRMSRRGSLEFLQNQIEFQSGTFEAIQGTDVFVCYRYDPSPAKVPYGWRLSDCKLLYWEDE